MVLNHQEVKMKLLYSFINSIFFPQMAEKDSRREFFDSSNFHLMHVHCTLYTAL